MGAEGACQYLYRKDGRRRKDTAMKAYNEQFSNPYEQPN